MTERGEYGATSERVCPDDYQQRDDEYLIYVFHTATYDHAATRVGSGRVLDFGCGTGYGDERIADGCAHVTGVDVSDDAIAYAQRVHAHPKVDYRRIAPIDDVPLPFEAADFDAVLSFQVIEHVPDPAAYVAEAARVTRPGGLLVLATPDRRTRLWPRQRPWNRYHLTEFDPDELVALLDPWYEIVEVAGLGASPQILDAELSRTRRLRLLSLPFTFPGAPEPWRQWGLRALKAFEGRRRSGRSDGAAASPTVAGTMGEAVALPTARPRSYDERDIHIRPGIWPSTNVVLVARRRQS